jgi:hypothetical protein
MSDPYIHPPGTNPPRHVRQDTTTRWTLVAIALLLFLGIGLWEFNNRQDRSASNDEASTVGRSERAPTPLPAHPNGTQPPLDAYPETIRR